MPNEFEGDLTQSVFWGADLTGARLRDVNLTGVTISHAWVVDVSIDALVERLVVNGVDVTAYVNEHDPWYPLRSLLRPTDPADMRAAWAALEAEWRRTTALALALPAARLQESVGGEWSFVSTLRHLVFAMDKWFTVPVDGGAFAPIGWPNTGSLEFPWPGLDLDAAPEVGDVLAVRADRAARFGAYLHSLPANELDREVEVLENGVCPVRECLYTVFEEEFWHNRYALRDLAHLGAAVEPGRRSVP